MAFSVSWLYGKEFVFVNNFRPLSFLRQHGRVPELFRQKEINTYSALSRTIVNDSIDQELRSVLRTFLLAFSIGFGGKRARNRAQKLLDFVVREVTFSSRLLAFFELVDIKLNEAFDLMCNS